jgi:hypothetical protein
LTERASHPEFLEATTHARDLAQQWWEDAGQVGMLTPGFNASVWAKNISARFREDWSESKHIVHEEGPNRAAARMDTDSRILELLGLRHDATAADEPDADDDVKLPGLG